MRPASLLLAALLGTLLLPRSADACGPDFPPDYLSSRAATLTGLPDGSFLLEASRLLPPPAEKFEAVEGEEPPDARKDGEERETELYTAGASAFREGRLDEARARFEEVLALPEKQRIHFSTFAAYMLGRMASDPEEAARRYLQVRELAKKGLDDPLGLAVASLGQEGRLALDRGDDVAAVTLYAQQAAFGSHGGAASLLFVAREVVADDARAQRLAADKLGQRLLATYVWTRSNELAEPDAWLDTLSKVPDLAGADRLAAAAWRQGQFELAERFAGMEKTPLAFWVQAKLALRKGDRVEADRLLEQAAAGYPHGEEWGGEYGPSHRPHDQIEGERAALALAKGDFPAAFERALASCAWDDIAYVAERLLTLDELKARVDRGVKIPCVSAPSLRALLGRRLLRSGRDAESLAYFDDAPTAATAKALVEARAKTAAAKDALDRAEALWALARLTRVDGMETLGTEGAPDWAMHDGSFALETLPQCPGALRPDERLPFPAMLPAECERLTANNPGYEVRFHYRSTAADLAERAAELVPPRSQAYAALLCTAAQWASSSQPERVQHLWQTYVRRGSCLVEGMTFPNRCPEPNFERLRNPPKKPLIAKPSWKKLRKRTLAAYAGGGVFLVGASITSLVFLRRRRASPPPAA